MTETDWLLSDEEIDALNADELEAYLEAVETLGQQWVLTPKQALAEEMAHHFDELLYGGQAGGGKSELLLYHVYHLSLRYPGHNSLLLRRFMPELRRSLILRALRIFDPREAHYRPADFEWRFRNGSRIEFGHLNQETDIRKYLSAEYDFIGFDEGTDFTLDEYTEISSRCRTTVRMTTQGVRPHVMMCTNPGGPGHDFVRDRFVIPTGYGTHEAILTLTVDNESVDRKIGFIPAAIADNPHIDPNYRFQLAALPSYERRQQLLHGDWDVNPGSFFSEWDRTIHIIEPFTIPPNWPRMCGIDYGGAAPFCCLWGAFDTDGNVYIYREAYERGHTALEQARMIRKASGNEPIQRYMADPSMWNRQGSGMSIADMYRSGGIVLAKASNRRIDGWSRMRDYLRGDLLDPDKHPGLRVFAGCENLIRTLPEMLHDKTNLEDLNTTKEDHACFPAGTMVETSHGVVAIEDVEPGDLVATRAGWRPVVAAAWTGNRELVRLTHTNGELTCTPDHPIWTARGWIRADRLRYGDSLVGWARQSKSSSSTGSPSAVTPTLPTAPNGSTSRPARIIADGVLGDFTRKSGGRRTDRSHPVITSTTATMIPSTTSSTTSGAFLAVSTWWNMAATSFPTWSIWPESVHSRWSGIAAKRAEPGIGRTWSTRWTRLDFPDPEPVSTAVPTTKPAPRKVGSARTTARWLRDALARRITRNGRALTAAPSSSATGTAPTAVALVSVLSVSAPTNERVPVYNLSVEGEHEFFADGILVSNCDACRYLLIARHPKARKIADEKPDPRKVAGVHRDLVIARRGKRVDEMFGNRRV